MSETPQFTKRYKSQSTAKENGVTYTPEELSDFVAKRIIETANLPTTRPIRIMDPAVGHGQLIISLLKIIDTPVEVYGFEIDREALENAKRRIELDFPEASISFHNESFLEHTINEFDDDLLQKTRPYDLIIANPPYVRTQALGAQKANEIAVSFGLTGRIDLYQAFIEAMVKTLAPSGTTGFIVSNRFMTTKGGSATRLTLQNSLVLEHVYDLGDTKLFDAAVLPAVIIGHGLESNSRIPTFTSIYETNVQTTETATSPIKALDKTGDIIITDGRCFKVTHGNLKYTHNQGDIWCLTSPDTEKWLNIVSTNTWKTFRDIGKVKVGVKTCADKVFLPKTWNDDLELHHPLTTHHVARRYKSNNVTRKILYPHETVNGKKSAVDISKYPKSNEYLEQNRKTLEARSYVIESGRNWFEIWVPQNPSDWIGTKLVFRDISEKPTFWLDKENTIVNGDCYWLKGSEELLWLALAVSNSTFIERFYDNSFNNKLYSGKRRFITQYVEKFPLPCPQKPETQKMVLLCQLLYNSIEDYHDTNIENEIDILVWKSFGLTREKI